MVCRVRESADHVFAVFILVRRREHELDRDRQRAPHLAGETPRLMARRRMHHDHEHVEIAVLVWLPIGVRTEEHDPRGPNALDELLRHLLDLIRCDQRS